MFIIIAQTIILFIMPLIKIIVMLNHLQYITLKGCRKKIQDLIRTFTPIYTSVLVCYFVKMKGPMFII